VLPGKLIVIDGARGCNREPVVEMLEEKFQEADLYFLHEPQGSHIASELEGILRIYGSLSFRNKPEFALTSFARFLYFLATRQIFTEQVLEPKLEAGHNVLLKRFDCSTFAYQIFGEELYDMSMVFWSVREKMMKRWSEKKIHPPYYIILGVDPKTGYERTRERWTNRKGFEEHLSGYFDFMGMEFHERVNRAYLEFSGRVMQTDYLNSNQDADKVAEEAAVIISKVLSW
jgi:thymidylate kinase